MRHAARPALLAALALLAPATGEPESRPPTLAGRRQAGVDKIGAPSATDLRFTALSFNILGVGRPPDMPGADALADAVLELDPDVAALQEIFEVELEAIMPRAYAETRAPLETRFAAAGRETFYARATPRVLPTTMMPIPVGGGNLLAMRSARFAVLERRAVALSSRLDLASLGVLKVWRTGRPTSLLALDRRGAAYGLLELLDGGGKPLRLVDGDTVRLAVFGFHLDHGPERTAEAGRLIAATLAVRPGVDHVLLLGDANDLPGGSAMRRILAGGFSDAMADSDAVTFGHGLPAADRRRRRIDYLLYTAANQRGRATRLELVPGSAVTCLGTDVAGRVPLSDHLGVTAAFRVRLESSTAARGE